MNPSILKKAIDNTVESMLRRHQAEAELNALLPVATALLEPMLTGLDLEDPFDCTSKAYMEMYPLPGREVVLTLALYDLESLKDPRLTQALEAFLPWGDPEVSDCDWIDVPDRVFKFKKKFEEGLLLTVRIRGVVGRTSSTCRKVQVGTKTVESPIYEVVCE